MVVLPRDTYTRQKWLIAAILLALLAVPLAQSLSWYAFGWPGFPAHRDLSPEKYAERMVLLKYIMSLGLSIIGATWFLTTRDTARVSSDDPDFRLLSWSWTFIGIAILSAYLEIYLTYKDFHYWPIIAAGGDGSSLSRIRHCAHTRALHMTYVVTDGAFLIGGVILVFAAIRLLHKGHSPKPADAEGGPPRR